MLLYFESNTVEIESLSPPLPSYLAPSTSSLNRLLLGLNNKRGLAGAGIDFESSVNLKKMLARGHELFGVWYQMYIDNIHLLNLKPNMWVKSNALPVVGEVILFDTQPIHEFDCHIDNQSPNLVIGFHSPQFKLKVF